MTRSVLIVVKPMLHHRNERHGDMRAPRQLPSSESCGRPSLLVTHQRINVQWSTPGEAMIFLSPKLDFGVWVPQQSRDVQAKALYRTVKVGPSSQKKVFMTAAVPAPLQNEPEPDPQS
jgi:hypothetical protein